MWQSAFVHALFHRIEILEWNRITKPECVPSVHVRERSHEVHQISSNLAIYLVRCASLPICSLQTNVDRNTLNWFRLMISLVKCSFWFLFLFAPYIGCQGVGALRVFSVSAPEIYCHCWHKSRTERAKREANHTKMSASDITFRAVD